MVLEQELGLIVGREFDPGRDRFPCGFCDTRAHCFNDDLRTSVEPELLFVIPKIEEEVRDG